jgi:hypothetical protein
MMEQERRGQDLKDLILVGIGRFNQLPLESDGGERELDNLIADNSDNQSLSETTILSRLNVLRTTIDQASAFTSQQELIVLLDQLMGIADLAKRSTSITVASEDFLANLHYPISLDQSKRMRDKWGKLSQKLQATDPRSTLGKQLGYFANDGGIGRLRELIQTYASTHGQKQLIEDTSRAYQALCKQQQQLQVELAKIDIPVKESQALLDLRESIGKLHEVYKNSEVNLSKEPLKNRSGVTVAETVKEELIFKIFDWEEWTLLFNRANNGLIQLPESQGAVPNKSEDFYPTFAKTIEELEKFAGARIREAVIDLLNKLANDPDDTSLQRERIQGIISAETKDELKKDIEEKFGASAAKSFDKLTLACDLNLWLKEIFAYVDSQNQPLSPQTIFPLATPDDQHKTGTIFHWSLKPNEIKSSPANQQMLVFRLRDEIIASASLHLVEYVRQVNQQVNKKLADILKDIIPELQKISKKQDLLRYLADKKSPQETATPNWFKILSEISSTPLT